MGQSWPMAADGTIVAIAQKASSKDL